MAEGFDRADNIALIRDNLKHLNLELDAGRPQNLRIAKEAYHLLQRAMVECLCGTANLLISGRPRDPKRRKLFRIGEGPWMAVQRSDVEGCKEAWRFTDPVPAEEPPLVDEDSGSKKKKKKDEEFQVGFYDLLAMVQSVAFMSRTVGSTPVDVSDDEMVGLEWLHREMRNDFEHFMPKTVYSSPDDVLAVASLCVRLTKQLLIESNAVMPFYVKGLGAELDATLSTIQTLMGN